MVSPRIVSLLPGATEMVAALGAAELLVGISHECDWPASVQQLPRVTATPIDVGKSSGEIHRAVQDTAAAGQSAIGIEADVLRQLRPDLIITQSLCDVCAVADGEAMRLAAALSPAPTVVTLSGRTLDGVWDDVRNLGLAIDRADDGEQLAADLRDAAAREASINHVVTPPSVVAIEWLDPLFLAGHWVPEMIAAAGGRDIGAAPGSHSVIHEWDSVMALDPDIVLVILCGFSEARARAELAAMAPGPAREWLASRRVIVLDGNAFTSRPGPRLIEGIRLMARGFAGTMA